MSNTQGTLSSRERLVELVFHTQVQIMKSRTQNLEMHFYNGQYVLFYTQLQIMKSRTQNLEMHFYNECLRERNEVASQYVPSQKPKL